MNKIKWINFYWRKLLSNKLFIQEHCKLTTFEKISTFFRPPYSQSLHKVLFLIFGFFPFHINSICILVSKLIVVVDISVTKARRINFEIANDLKTTILLPSIVKFLSFHNFKIFWILTIWFNTKSFLTFSGGIEMWHWTKMGQCESILILTQDTVFI